MARIEWVEHRLQNWARWRLGSGGGSLGYSASRPTPEGVVLREPYAEVPIPVSEIEASDTDALVSRLPGELRRTVEEWYVGTGTLAEKLARLCCAARTLHDRIDRAHRIIAEHLHAKRQRQDDERRRVEALQQGRRP